MCVNKTSTDSRVLNLVEKVRALWLPGDWERVVSACPKDNSKASELKLAVAPFAINALLQLGKIDEVRGFLDGEGEERVGGEAYEMCKAVIASLHTTLGRASALLGKSHKARNHFSKGIAIISPQSNTSQIIRMRDMEQCGQLGLPPILGYELRSEDCLSKVSGQKVLELAQQLSPKEPGILIGLAEAAQQRKQYKAAITYWQNLAALLQENMPQVYYERLEEAYQHEHEFPLGLLEEEVVKGKLDKYTFLLRVHEALKPEFYFEIGVQKGRSLLLSQGKAIGVDPMPAPNIRLKPHQKIVKMSSDAFFFDKANILLTSPPELIFIDGMHLFEYALRDFINIEKYSDENTVVIIDDIFPSHPAQAERKRRTRFWTGDVWKVYDILSMYRKDLKLSAIDASPTGVLVVEGLDPRSRVLDENYARILDDYIMMKLPESYVERVGAQDPERFLEEWCRRKT